MASQTPVDQIGFSTGTGLVSRIIRWFTRSTVSHAWILYFDQEFGCDCILEATAEGFRIQSFEKFRSENRIIATFTPKIVLTPGFKSMAAWLGAYYDFGGLFGMAWVLLGRWLRRRWRNPLASSRTMFCSEAVARLCFAAGYRGDIFEQPENTSPQDLYEFFLNEGSSHAETHP